MELQKLHPPEDEILNQYLVPAICKAAAVLGMVSSETNSDVEDEKCTSLPLLFYCILTK